MKRFAESNPIFIYLYIYMIVYIVLFNQIIK
jgi:hypothetical protein